MSAVAGVTPDQCTEDADSPWNAASQSFTCTLETGEIQVGRFLKTSTKAERVAKYQPEAQSSEGQSSGHSPAKHVSSQRHLCTLRLRDLDT